MASPERLHWVLGESFGSLDAARAACQELMWISYRRNMERIGTTTLTSDTGWGCMVRTGQMMLAHVWRRVLSGGRWYEEGGGGAAAGATVTPLLVRWFTDHPRWANVYSFHNIAEIGAYAHSMRPGEWYGPWKIAVVLRDLVARHHHHLSGPLAMAVCPDGTVYRDQVDSLCTCGAQGAGRGHWQRRLFLMLPLRLGPGSTVEPEYVPTLARLFRLPQCVGLAGGSPRHSLWFVGVTPDGSFLCLDPHTTQDTPPYEHPPPLLAATRSSTHPEYAPPSRHGWWDSRQPSAPNVLTKGLRAASGEAVSASSGSGVEPPAAAAAAAAAGGASRAGDRTPAGSRAGDAAATPAGSSRRHRRNADALETLRAEVWSPHEDAWATPAHTGSFRVRAVRTVPGAQVDSSLAVGLYCRDKDDFEDLCERLERDGISVGPAAILTVQGATPAWMQAASGARAAARSVEGDDDADDDDADAGGADVHGFGLEADDDDLTAVRPPTLLEAFGEAGCASAGDASLDAEDAAGDDGDAAGGEAAGAGEAGGDASASPPALRAMSSWEEVPRPRETDVEGGFVLVE